MCWESSEEGGMWRSLILYVTVTLGSLLLSVLSEVWGHALPFLSIQLLCFHSVLYLELRKTEVFVPRFCSFFRFIPGFVYVWLFPNTCLCRQFGSCLLMLSSRPLLFCPPVDIVCGADRISGRDKDSRLYSEWLAGSLILRNTVRISHQSAWEDRDIYRAPLHSTVA